MKLEVGEHYTFSLYGGGTVTGTFVGRADGLVFLEDTGASDPYTGRTMTAEEIEVYAIRNARKAK